MARLKVKYTEEIAPALMKKFQYKSVMPLPLGELSPQVTERASLWPQSCGGVIGKSFVRAIVSLCF